jgi:excisionase family DNA binding protein
VLPFYYQLLRELDEKRHNALNVKTLYGTLPHRSVTGLFLPLDGTSPYARELATIDPIMYRPVSPTLLPLLSILETLLQRTAPEPEKTAPASESKPVPESPYMDFDEACAYLRLTERQLKDLCRDQRITHSRIDYRTYRFKKSDLDEWFEAYKLRRKSVFD